MTAGDDFNGNVLIWDWNGTLMDDAWLCIHSLNTLLAERGLPLETFEQYRQRFRFPVKGYYEELGFDFSCDDMEQISIRYINTYNDRRFECALQAESLATLAEFQRAGWQQAILSAYRQDMLRETVHRYELANYFEAIRGLDNLQALGKASLGCALLAEQGWVCDKVVLVGDTSHDYEVAQAMGVRCVLVSHGHYDHARLVALGVPVYASFCDLRRALLSNSPEKNKGR
ncbi:MAG: HAD hydrolase-like protein [Verrucomicrobiota bacterium]|nr:HAD hydrolase-like protein [Verrucomicrobiota bacterium]